MSTTRLEEVAELTRRTNEARSAGEYVEIARGALAKLRDGLSRSIDLANADVPKDGPMAPAGALVTASFTHVGELEWALSWAARKLNAAQADGSATVDAPQG